MGTQGEWNVGQLVRERGGQDAMLVGFTTHSGTVTAASNWGAATERKSVRLALPASYEALFHDSGLERFLLIFRGGGEVFDALRQPRLERAIGVIYGPETERASHYFHAIPPDKFDAVIHNDRTRAVEPLERTSEWEAHEWVARRGFEYSRERRAAFAWAFALMVMARWTTMGMALRYELYRELRAYVGWGDDDARRVKGSAQLLDKHLPALIDDFCAEIERHPDVRKVITGGSEQIERLKSSLSRWVRELLGGVYDGEYVQRRWRVGCRHVEIGLDQVFTRVALSRLRTGLCRALRDEWEGSHGELGEAVRLLNMLLRNGRDLGRFATPTPRLCGMTSVQPLESL